MRATTIVFPTDFSEHSHAALGHATALVRDTGAMLLIVHVHQPAERFADTGFVGYPVNDDEQDLNRMLSDVKPTESGVGFTHTLLTGNPAEEILRFAEERDADMIVLGTHGRTGLSRLLMGSVAEAVVRGAKCPVLTIKQPAGAEVGV